METTRSLVSGGDVTCREDVVGDFRGAFAEEAFRFVALLLLPYTLRQMTILLDFGIEVADGLYLDFWFA